MSETVDICIVGAGPAGVLAAWEAVRQGASVRLVGAPAGAMRVESMTGVGARLLAALGLADALAGAAMAGVERLDLEWRAKPETREMSGDGPLLVARPRLERLMAEAAMACGVRHDPRRRARKIEPGGIVTLDDGATVAARVVLDAAGRRAPFRARPRALMPPLAAIGFRGRAPERPAGMALRADPDGWLWTARLPDGQVHGVWAGEPGMLSGLGAAERRRFLSARCGALDPVPTFVADAALVAAPAVVDGNVLRIGDAALARDPVSSHGLAWALGSAARGVAAALTLIGPHGERDAARAFLSGDHDFAVREASAACTAAYADQARHAGAFWSARAGTPTPTDAPLSADPPPGTRVALRAGVRLGRAAVLEEGRIRWRDALHFPDGERPAGFLAGCPAAVVHAALATPGEPHVLARRLHAHLSPSRAEAVIGMLWRAGALEHEIAAAADSTGD